MASARFEYLLHSKLTRHGSLKTYDSLCSKIFKEIIKKVPFVTPNVTNIWKI